MSDDYTTIIASLETTRDSIAADLANTATELAELVAVPNFSESGDGGSESIDSVGLRRQLMDEIKEKGELVRQLSITIASLQPGIGIKRIPRGCRLWRG